MFPLNNFILLWPIDTKLSVWVAYIKRQLGIATQVSVIRSRSCDHFSLFIYCSVSPYPSTKPVRFLVTIHTSPHHFFFSVIFHFFFLLHQYMVESLKTWFSRIAAFLVLNNLRLRIRKMFFSDLDFI